MAPHVAILAQHVYGPSGEPDAYPGRVRYARELTRLLLDLGSRVEWFQTGTGWTGDLLPGVPVYALRTSEPVHDTLPDLCQVFSERATDADLAVYFDVFLAYPVALPRSISVAHGIYWDHPGVDHGRPTERERSEWLRRLQLAIGSVRTVVSVDTTFVNWLRAQWPALAPKCRYIPNFVDVRVFTPPEDDRQGRDGLSVVFPRKMVTVRGVNEAGQAALRLTRAVPDLSVHLVGPAQSAEAAAALERWVSGHERIYWYTLPQDRMPRLFQEADVAWFPSKACEGMPFACLEAMASGCSVVASGVGGLAELVQDGYSGLLVPPEAKALASATMRLGREPELRRLLGRRARQVAASYSLERWRWRWRRLLAEVCPVLTKGYRDGPPGGDGDATSPWAAGNG